MFNLMKRFGLPYKYLHSHIINSREVLVMQHPKYGAIQVPKSFRFSSVEYVVQLHKHKLEYQKFFNPFGYMKTLPYTAKKEQPQFDFIDINIARIRTKPELERQGIICIRTNENISKLELKQYLTKLYNFNIEKMGVTIVKGKVKKQRSVTAYYMLPSYKKWTIQLKKKEHPTDKPVINVAS